jgi:hypothetical protein
VQEKYLRGVLRVDRKTWGIGWEWKREREKFEDKMEGREDCRILTECWREKKKTENKEREKYYQSNGWVCQWRSGKIESKRKMDECRAEWKGQRHRQARKKGEHQRIKIQVWEVYDRGNSEVRRTEWKKKWWRNQERIFTQKKKTKSWNCNQYMDSNSTRKHQLKRCNFSFPPRESGLLRLSNPFSATMTGRFGMGTVWMGA